MQNLARAYHSDKESGSFLLSLQNSQCAGTMPLPQLLQKSTLI